MSGGEPAPRCGAGFPPCAEPAEWAIAIGEELRFACGRHRNEVLVEFEPKDISGVFPLAALDDPEEPR